jgi:NADPH-dependent ferric siderophore reductase
MSDANTMERAGRSILRVRYESRLRLLTVRAVRQLTPHMIRIDFSVDFSEFKSLGFDDHIKLFFPDPETGVLTLPVPNAIPSATSPKPIGRDYTPRAFSSSLGELTIDFAVHTAGPATAWAMAAKVGDTLHQGGPRGSMLIPDAFDGYVMIGDDTALPAMARRLEELALGTPAFVVAEVDGPDDEIVFNTLADLTLHWVHRSARRGPTNLNDALHGLFVPQNDVHTWVACEGEQAKRVRQQLIDDHGINPAWLKASGYWHRGEAGAHSSIGDRG